MNQEEINEIIDNSVPEWRWLQIQAERERTYGQTHWDRRNKEIVEAQEKARS